MRFVRAWLLYQDKHCRCGTLPKRYPELLFSQGEIIQLSRWVESMAEGDFGTYGTVLRVTPLTEGTGESIRMTNPGITSEAG